MYNYKKLLSRVLICARPLPSNKNRHIILLYHSLGESEASDYLSLRVRPESFKEQMAYLAKQKYNVVALSEIVNNLNSGSRPQVFDSRVKCNVSITFDDGYLDILQFAVPVLKKYAFPTTLFIATDYLCGKADKKDYWEKWEYLTSEKVRWLASNGIEIGSHSCSHKPFSSLDNYRIREEASFSKKVLENIVRNRITLFSYPHGVFSERIKNILREEGYSAACTSITGFNDSRSDLFELKRIEIRGDDSLADFKNKLMGYYNWLGYFRRMKYKFR